MKLVISILVFGPFVPSSLHLYISTSIRHSNVIEFRNAERLQLINEKIVIWVDHRSSIPYEILSSDLRKRGRKLRKGDVLLVFPRLEKRGDSLRQYVNMTFPKASECL